MNHKLAPTPCDKIPKQTTIELDNLALMTISLLTRSNSPEFTVMRRSKSEDNVLSPQDGDSTSEYEKDSHAVKVRLADSKSRLIQESNSLREPSRIHLKGQDRDRYLQSDRIQLADGGWTEEMRRTQAVGQPPYVEGYDADYASDSTDEVRLHPSQPPQLQLPDPEGARRQQDGENRSTRRVQKKVAKYSTSRSTRDRDGPGQSYELRSTRQRSYYNDGYESDSYV